MLGEPTWNVTQPERRGLSDDHVAAGEARLREAAGDDPRFAGFVISEVVVVKGDRVVARGCLGQAEVYLKLMPRIGGERMVQAACAEFDRMSAIMGTGPLRIARLAASAPERRLIATEAVQGERFDQAVNAAPAAGRRLLYRRAGLWLGLYASPTRRAVPFDPASFLGHVRGLVLESSGGAITGSRTRRWASADLMDEDRERREALRRWIVARAVEVAGIPVSIAAAHDDFTPTNLVVTRAGTLVGYDISGWYVCAVANAAARMLTVQPNKRDVESGGWMGLDGDHVEGFLDSGVLAGDEAERLLPLYVGQKLDKMLGRHADQPASRARVRRSIDAFLRCAHTQ